MAISIKLAVILVVSAILTSAQGISIPEAKNLKAQKKILGFLTFGDSSVDSGNNDFLLTPFKSNFAPYGINYFNHTPNGRFCDGRLAADFVVEYFDFGNYVPAYLDPDLKAKYITHEKYVATFASAGSGYDPLTALYGLVNPLSAQLELFKQYKQTMIGRLGSKKAQNTMDKVICLISAGTNDLILSYIGNPFSIRRLQYTQDGYEDYLVTLMRQYIEEMHQQGCKRIAVAGVPPIGCMPVVKLMTFTAGNSCSDTCGHPPEEAHISNSNYYRFMHTNDVYCRAFLLNPSCISKYKILFPPSSRSQTSSQCRREIEVELSSISKRSISRFYSIHHSGTKTK